MKTSKNVTELQPRMTREQLIDAARTAARYASSVCSTDE